MLIKLGDSQFDKILAHHKNPDAFPLTEVEKRQKDRWSEAFKLLLNHFSKREIVDLWVKEKGLSEAQAYADIKNAQSLYGNVLKADKEADRAIWIAWVQDYLKRCKQKGDRKNEGKALDLLAKYAGFANEDNPLFNPKKLENVEIQFVLDKEYLDLLKKIMAGGVANFNLDEPLDVEFEEITNARPD